METENFSITFTYDNKGRLSTRTHPSGIVETNNYNSNGYLASISAGGATRYTLVAMNARQQITAASFGTSLSGVFGFDDYGYPTHTKAHVSGTYRQDYRYSFNPVTGNLNSRQNYLLSKSESFTYDNLDRLKTVTGPQNLTMDYAANGNILTKSDVGTNTFEYNHPTKPYALTDLETASGLVPEDLQVATYTSFEQVSTIDEGDYHATLTYNSDDQRAKILVTDLGSTILTRWYAGSRYVKEVKGSSTRHYTWIGGDAYTAPVLVYQYGTTTNWYYVLRDYLGNITHLVWTSNNVTAEYSFDAWGRRRDKDDWSYTLAGDAELIGDRGFTGHEWLPWFNLYNMNGRLYDPVVGRFLSPDENVQMPDFSQNFNRYSYALNNPLKFTDPDGESLILLAAIIGGWMGMGQAMISSDKQGWGMVGDMAKGLFVGAAAGAAGAWTGGAVAGAIGTGGFLGGAASGFVGGFSGGFVGGAGGAWMNGADFGQGLSAGLNGGITSGLISGGIGGLVGGFSSMSKHGNFWDGDFITGPATAGLEGGGKVYGPFSIREVTVSGNYKLGMGAVRNASWAYGITSSISSSNYIDAKRIASSPKSTVSKFTAYGKIPYRPVEGYFLEPGGPSTYTSGMDKIIPADIYNLEPYSGNWENVYRLSNELVLRDRGILIHPGNFHYDTSGCLLPGSSYSLVNGNYAVWNSKTVMNQLRDIIGNNNAQIIIHY